MKLRKMANRALAAAFIVFLIDWSIMGIKLLDNNYNIIVEAHIGLVCYIVIMVSIFIRCLTDRCPHCVKIKLINGAYCTYCGKKLDNQTDKKV